MGNSKRKKRPEAQLKENKQEKHDKKRRIISVAALAVSIILIVGVGLFIALNDRISASRLLRNTRSYVENEPIEAIVIADDKAGDPLKPGIHRVYENDEMTELRNALISVLKNSKYKEIIEADKGFWKTKIVLYNTTDSRTLYIDASGVYISSQGRVARYEVDKKAQNEFALLLQYVNEAIKW